MTRIILTDLLLPQISPSIVVTWSHDVFFSFRRRHLWVSHIKYDLRPISSSSYAFSHYTRPINPIVHFPMTVQRVAALHTTSSSTTNYTNNFALYLCARARITKSEWLPIAHVSHPRYCLRASHLATNKNATPQRHTSPLRPTSRLQRASHTLHHKSTYAKLIKWYKTFTSQKVHSGSPERRLLLVLLLGSGLNPRSQTRKIPLGITHHNHHIMGRAVKLSKNTVFRSLSSTITIRSSSVITVSAIWTHKYGPVNKISVTLDLDMKWVRDLNACSP